MSERGDKAFLGDIREAVRRIGVYLITLASTLTLCGTLWPLSCLGLPHG